jgi:hypothetical protein
VMMNLWQLWHDDWKLITHPKRRKRLVSCLELEAVTEILNRDSKCTNRDDGIFCFSKMMTETMFNLLMFSKVFFLVVSLQMYRMTLPKMLTTTLRWQLQGLKHHPEKRTTETIRLEQCVEHWSRFEQKWPNRRPPRPQLQLRHWYMYVVETKTSTRNKGK